MSDFEDHLPDSEASRGVAANPGATELAAEVEPPDDSNFDTEERRDWRPGLMGVTLAALAASLLLPLSWSGIWDPYELEIAELSRRIAVNLMNAPALVLPGADNRIPILGDLAKGQLPFSSVALGFKIFGLHDWAGRLPLALWGLVGVGATFVLVRRLFDTTAAWFSALVLATTPLYFLHARTMLGDITTMALFAVASLGLAVAVFDERVRVSSGKCLAFLTLGLLGLAGGFASRGLALGVAVPALSVGLAWLCLGRSPEGRSAGDWVGALALILGIGALGVGGYALLRSSEEQYSMLVGAEILSPNKMPTHDSVFHQLGHGMMPWSALLPFAFGALLRPSLVGDTAVRRRETALKLLIICSFGVATLVHVISAQFTGDLPFVAVTALAMAVAIMARDFERGRPASIATAIGVAALLVLLYSDFKNFPEKGSTPFVLGAVKIPESFKEIGIRYIKYGTLVALVGGLLAFLERDGAAAELFLHTRRETPRRAFGWVRRSIFSLFSRSFWLTRAGFRSADYRAWPATLQAFFKGNPLYSLVPLQVALIALSVLSYGAARGSALVPAALAERLPKGIVPFAWAILPALLLAPFALIVARDTMRVFVRLIPATRASIACFSFAAFGMIMSLGYYPALAGQTSPKEVFASYESLAEPGTELGMIGSSSGAAAYYARGGVQVFASATQAFAWLNEKGAGQRYIVVASADLARLNSLFRASTVPPQNLPVLDSRSSEILLVSNQLGSRANKNPLESIVRSEKPVPGFPLEASFEDQLDCLGWEITTPSGEVVDSLRTGTSYNLRIYYEVIDRVTGNWQTFVHLDGEERINLDHDTTQGKYPFNLWNKGDFIADIYPFEIPRTYSKGRYGVHFGLFTGSKRKAVTRGEHADNRLNGGSIEIE